MRGLWRFFYQNPFMTEIEIVPKWLKEFFYSQEVQTETHYLKVPLLTKKKLTYMTKNRSGRYTNHWF